MSEPAYVRIAGEYARRIRSRELPPGVQLPSYREIAQQHYVSDIVVRKALELLQSQGLVRSVRRRGVFVTDRPNLVRVSPERQMETAEQSFQNESEQRVKVERETRSAPATEEIAESLGVRVGEQVNHVVTRASEGGRPISISDTYHPLDVSDTSGAVFLEETVSDQMPIANHADWLMTPSGDTVKTIHQRFLAENDKAIMISSISYPRDRYEAFVFRMSLR